MFSNLAFVPLFTLNYNTIWYKNLIRINLDVAITISTFNSALRNDEVQGHVLANCDNWQVINRSFIWKKHLRIGWHINPPTSRNYTKPTPNRLTRGCSRMMANQLHRWLLQHPAPASVMSGDFDRGNVNAHRRIDIF